MVLTIFIPPKPSPPTPKAGEVKEERETPAATLGQTKAACGFERLGQTLPDPLLQPRKPSRLEEKEEACDWLRSYLAMR